VPNSRVADPQARELDRLNTTLFALAIGPTSLLKAAICLWAMALPVRVTTNDGNTIEGNLQSIDESGLRIEAGAESVDLPSDRLSALAPQAVEPKTGPPMQVLLLDGSRVAAQDLTFRDDKLSIEPRRQPPLDVDASRVKAIRFRGAGPATDAQWLGLLEQEGRGDLMAIRREGDRLDPYRGLILSIADGKVAIDLDGSQVDAPIERLEGVVFGGNRSVVEDAAVRIEDVYGSSWAAQSISLDQSDGRLSLSLQGDLKHQLPLDQIASIRWSSGLRLLAGTRPAEQSFQSYFQAGLNTPDLTRWFGPTVDAEVDLVMRGNSLVEYRVEPGFTKLVGSVVREPSVRRGGKVTVTISIDGKPGWSETVLDHTRLGFELPLEGVKRIGIEIDSGDDGDLGDTVRIVRPRLVK
jgi:hypothetical protein